MVPEKETSSSSRSSLWPLALLGILSVLAWFTSKRTKYGDTPHPKGAAHNDDSDAPPTPFIKADSIPANYCNYEPGRGKNHAWWEKASSVAQVVIALVTLGLLIVNIGQMRTVKGQLKDFEAVQAGMLVIQDLKGEAFTDSEGTEIKISYVIKNAGLSVATNISNGGASGTLPIDRNSLVVGCNAIKPGNIGDSMAPQQSQPVTYNIRETGPDERSIKEFMAGKIPYDLVIQYAWMDVFSRPHSTAACLHRLGGGSFIRCIPNCK